MPRTALGFCVLPFLLLASAGLAAETGMLYVKSEPPGATVLVDGEERGKTPLLVKNLEAGHHVLQLRLADIRSEKELVEVEAGKVTNHSVRMRQEPASLTVISEPLEAAVHLDRRERGETPVTIEELEPGEHEVILFLVDYERAVRKVNLEPGETRVLEVKLRRIGAPPFPEGEKPAAVEAMDEAEEKFAKLLGRFEEMIDLGDYAGSRRLAEQKARQRDLAELAVRLRAAAKVARALEARREAIRKGAEALIGGGKKVTLRTKAGPRKGKVEEVSEEGISLAAELRARGRVVGKSAFTVAWCDLAPAEEERLAKGWDGGTADAKVALAFLALARKDLAAAGRAVRGADEHPLASYVRGRIAETRRAPVPSAPGVSRSDV